MVADQPEDAALRKDCGLIIERAIAKVKGKPRSNPVAVSDLNEITRGESDALKRFENEKSVKGSLGAAYRNRVGGHLRCCCEKTHREPKRPPRGTS
jgi:hypothetical protein